MQHLFPLNSLKHLDNIQRLLQNLLVTQPEVNGHTSCCADLYHNNITQFISLYSGIQDQNQNYLQYENVSQQA